MSQGSTQTDDAVVDASSNDAAISVDRPWAAGSVASHRVVAIAAKRSIDFVGALLAIVVLAPLWLILAAAVKLDSPGSVFYRQRRVGRFGREFEMFKFRTMVDGAHVHRTKLRHLNEAPDGLFKITADPRVTRIGSFLRTTSLDELPQLLHLLTGEMSFVGPRPLVPEEDVLIPGDREARREMRPGMTGPWQVAGASKVPLVEMSRLDCEYARSWTVTGDLKLLLRTVPHVVRRHGI